MNQGAVVPADGQPMKLAKQTRIGSIRIDRLGRKWRKARRLSREEYVSAVVDGNCLSRLGLVTYETLYALGYELVEDAID